MNNNEHEALFIFSLLSYHTSTCFGVSAFNHQEVECIHVANGAGHISELTVSGPGKASSADIHLRIITSTIFHIHVYTFYLLMMGC
jgi:hypothetical protein